MVRKRERKYGWLVRALRREKACQILDDAGLHCGFMDGGCWVLAEAMRRLWGGTLYAAYRHSGLMDHVVLRLGEEQYLDADGLHTHDEMVKKMRDAERVPGRVALDPFVERRAGEIPYCEDAVRRLEEYLRGEAEGKS
jgi:hypothetical protein